MDNRYLFLLSVVFFLCLTQTEGFISIYNDNLTTDSSNPDKKQFYPVANHNKIQLKDEHEETILGNNNYKTVVNSIQKPLKGPYSAFLDVHELRNFDHFYHAPITDKSFPFDVSFERQFNYEIIQEEDINKYELLEKEKENDSLIHNPFYLHGNPKNNSKILYSDDIQEMFLKVKDKTTRYVNVGQRGPGFHGID